MSIPIPVMIYNNLTRKKELFKPIVSGEVGLYSCGPTTYDFLHVGNGRALVIGDLIHRVLKTLGHKVTFVRNFTDVDDKIINEAKENNTDPLEHSAKFVKECIQDMNSLGMLPATFTPKVSECIPEIVQMVQDLIDNGYAYESEGEVLFNVPKFEGYGKLSKKKLEDLQHGKRVEVDSNKLHPSDFVLWKPMKEKNEISWDSPWSKGRPGWHIECSAMAKKFLGKSIDIHHGGIDLIFPHHENEIAQSEGANGCKFSNCWCHHEFIDFGEEKMSKSLGNVVTIRSIVEKFGGEILRQGLICVHYRSKMSWTEEVIERAIHDVERIHKFLVNYNHARKSNFLDSGDKNDTIIDEKIWNDLKEILPAMKKEIANDFNVPGMLAHFFTALRTVNREFLDESLNYAGKKKLSYKFIGLLDEIIDFVKNATGLVHDNPQNILDKVNNAKKNLSGADKKISAEKIEELISLRIAARKEKNWKEADRIRDELNANGVELKDSPDGKVGWSYK